MNFKKINLSFFAFLISGGLFFSACNSGTENDHGHDHEDGDHAHDEMMDEDNSSEKEEYQVITVEKPAPEEFQNQLNSLYEEYLEIKEALVNSSPEEVKNQLPDFREELENIDGSTLQDEDLKTNWSNLKKEISSNVKDMETDDLEKQRKAFEKLSLAMYQSAKTFGIEGNQVYRQYCPMAFNNQGAFWLSDNEEILNPYFGNKMLHCGSVKEEIKTAKQN